MVEEKMEIEKERILELQKRYEEGKITENKISKEDIESLMKLYENQIKEKNNNLRKYKEKIEKYIKINKNK